MNLFLILLFIERINEISVILSIPKLEATTKRKITSLQFKLLCAKFQFNLDFLYVSLLLDDSIV